MFTTNRQKHSAERNRNLYTYISADVGCMFLAHTYVWKRKGATRRQYMSSGQPPHSTISAADIITSITNLKCAEIVAENRVVVALHAIRNDLSIAIIAAYNNHQHWGTFARKAHYISNGQYDIYIYIYKVKVRRTYIQVWGYVFGVKPFIFIARKCFVYSARIHDVDIDQTDTHIHTQHISPVIVRMENEHSMYIYRTACRRPCGYIYIYVADSVSVCLIWS